MIQRLKARNSLDRQKLVVHELVLDGPLFVLEHVHVHVPDQLRLNKIFLKIISHRLNVLNKVMTISDDTRGLVVGGGGLIITQPKHEQFIWF
jgi:hypothetical protein